MYYVLITVNSGSTPKSDSFILCVAVYSTVLTKANLGEVYI